MTEKKRNFNPNFNPILLLKKRLNIKRLTQPMIEMNRSLSNIDIARWTYQVEMSIENSAVQRRVPVPVAFCQKLQSDGIVECISFQHDCLLIFFCVYLAFSFVCFTHFLLLYWFFPSFLLRARRGQCRIGGLCVPVIPRARYGVIYLSGKILDSILNPQTLLISQNKEVWYHSYLCIFK